MGEENLHVSLRDTLDTYLIWLTQFEQIKTIDVPLVNDLSKLFTIKFGLHPLSQRRQMRHKHSLDDHTIATVESLAVESVALQKLQENLSLSLLYLFSTGQESVHRPLVVFLPSILGIFTSFLKEAKYLIHKKRKIILNKSLANGPPKESKKNDLSSSSSSLLHT